MKTRIPHPVRAEGQNRTLPQGEVLEIPLLLPGWQVAALETEAHNRGLTAAEMVRRLLGDFITGLDEFETYSTPCGTGHDL